MRKLTFFDRLMGECGHALKTLTMTPDAHTEQPYPAEDLSSPELDEKARKHSAGLMRVDAVGEICAQALYRGQAFSADDEDTRAYLLHAAVEEQDHLVWCNRRLHELDSRSSVFNPFWYGASFCMGVGTGLMGDRWSLGFVIETENQVCTHLEEHLESLPSDDDASRAILSQMKADEAEHAGVAEAKGGSPLPPSMQTMMKCQSKVMTKTAYHL